MSWQEDLQVDDKARRNNAEQFIQAVNFSDTVVPHPSTPFKYKLKGKNELNPICGDNHIAAAVSTVSLLAEKTNYLGNGL